MVMEPPTPQCVGREFVRQYYTMLNQAPLHLHRFYSGNSSFVHGGLDHPGHETKPVVGQQEIHQKIMQLNFRDCHAKIRQVDSHETLGSGVVVQVTGELSNNGQPMRRFMQTFVLAPQSPKKYYVRNDIFRYQDEIFNEDDDDDTQEAVEDVLSGAESEVDGQNVSGSTDGVQGNSPTYFDQDVRNGAVHINEQHLISGPPLAMSPEIIPTGVSDLEPVKSEWDVDDCPTSLEDKTSVSCLDEPEPPQSQPGTELKTYANMVSKNASPGSYTNSGPVGAGTPAPFPSSVVVQPKTESLVTFSKSDQNSISGGTGSTSGGGGSSMQTPFQPHRINRPVRTPLRGMNRMESRDVQHTPVIPRDDGIGDPDKRKPLGPQYPDSQQLFVGNLPHGVHEDDLKEYFLQYGNVVDMRINTKQNQKMTGGVKVPNFGFIVFEDAETVHRILGKKPLFYHGHRLNVEEKKTKPRDQRLGDNRIGGGIRGTMGRGGMGGRGGRGMGTPGRGDSRGGGRGGFPLRR